MKLRIIHIVVIVALCSCLIGSCASDQQRTNGSVSVAQRLYDEAYEHQRCGRLQQAMTLYLEAEQSAVESDSRLLVGDINARIGDLHTLYYDYPQALNAFCRAYDLYREGGDELAQNLILHSIAHNYAAMHRVADAKMLFVLVYNWAIFEGEDELKQRCMAALMELNHKYSDLETQRKVDLKDDTIAEDEEVIAWRDYDNSLFDVALLYDERMERPDSVVYNPMNRVQIEYLRKLSDMRMEQLEQEQTIKLLIIIIALIVIMLMAIVAFYQRHLRKVAVDSYIAEVQSLHQTLRSRESLISDMNDKILHSSASVEEMSEQINALFKRQFALLDSLVNTYYETRDINRDKEAIYKQVKGEIAKLSDKKNIAYLEEIINRHRGNVVADIRKSYPSISEQNITLLCYILAGFSAKSIGILLDCSIANVHTKRSRLKRQLQELDAASGQMYARLLG